jgi:hypothetical protein
MQSLKIVLKKLEYTHEGANQNLIASEFSGFNFQEKLLNYNFSVVNFQETILLKHNTME